MQVKRVSSPAATTLEVRAGVRGKCVSFEIARALGIFIWYGLVVVPGVVGIRVSPIWSHSLQRAEVLSCDSHSDLPDLLYTATTRVPCLGFGTGTWGRAQLSVCWGVWFGWASVLGSRAKTVVFAYCRCFM